MRNPGKGSSSSETYQEMVNLAAAGQNPGAPSGEEVTASEQAGGRTRRTTSAARLNVDLSLSERLFWAPLSGHGGTVPRVRWRIHHDSVFRRCWDAVTIVLCLYLALDLPIDLAFSSNTAGEGVMRTLQTCWFTMDVVFNFFTTLPPPKAGGSALPVSSLRAIGADYAKAWLLIDVLSSVPFEQIAAKLKGTACADCTQSNSSSSLAVLKLLKLSKLLRIFRLGRLVGKLQERYRITYSSVYIVQFFAVIFIAAHWLGCLFWVVGTSNTSVDNPGWVAQGSPVPYERQPVVDQYITSIYWAITTLTTIGYGDITPQGPYEKLFGIGAMCFGAMLFAYGLTNIVTLVVGRNERRSRFENQMDALTNFMLRHSVSIGVNRRVHRYLYYKQHISSMELFPGEQAAMCAALSPALRSELLAEVIEAAMPRSKPEFRGVLFHRAGECGFPAGQAESARLLRAVAPSLVIRAFGSEELVSAWGSGAEELAVSVLRGVDGARRQLCVLAKGRVTLWHQPVAAAAPRASLGVLHRQHRVSLVGTGALPPVAEMCARRFRTRRRLTEGASWGELACALGDAQQGLGGGGGFAAVTQLSCDVCCIGAADLAAALATALSPQLAALVLEGQQQRRKAGEPDFLPAGEYEPIAVHSDNMVAAAAEEQPAAAATSASGTRRGEGAADDVGAGGLAQLIAEQDRLIQLQAQHIADLRRRLGPLVGTQKRPLA